MILDEVLNILVKWYPKLKEELLFTAPEMFWLKIKHITGFDILEVKKSLKKMKKKSLKRKHVNFNDEI